MFVTKKNSPVVISGPSGAGKSTLIGLLIRDHPNFHLCISHTTRQRRKNERNGREYFFVAKLQFEKMIDDGEFFEYQKYGDNYYGTSNREISVENKVLLLDWERKGVQAARSRGFSARFIFIWCSKAQVEKRLRERAGSQLLNNDKESDIQYRLMEYDEDMKLYTQGLYDIDIENREKSEALKKLYAFLELISDIDK